LLEIDSGKPVDDSAPVRWCDEAVERARIWPCGPSLWASR